MTVPYEDVKVEEIGGNSHDKHDMLHTHPSFGIVRVTHPSGGGRHLYGSELKHNNTVSLEFSLSQERVGLGTSWVQENDMILRVEMSESQWASMVASQAGRPTQVTVREYRDGKLNRVPHIQNKPTRTEKSRQDYYNRIRRQEKAGQDLVHKLRELVTKGKANKGELQAILGEAQHAYTGSVEFAKFQIESFDEEMEAVVETSKTEVEACLQQLIVQTGLKTLQLGGSFGSNPALENKE